MLLPDDFLSEMKALLKEQYDDYLRAMDQEPVTGLRINPLKISVKEAEEILPFKLERVPWCPEGFVCDSKEKQSTHPYYYAGLYYLQEPAAMLPAAMVPVQKGMRILDACAAPGGKSTAIAARLGNSGQLFCNDLSASRQSASRRNLERFGIQRSLVSAMDVLELAQKEKEGFDAVLLDGPCSGEGMFRKDPSLIKSWIQKRPEEYAPLQKKLIKAAASMVKPGGYLVYSTCTFSVKEDEEVVLDLLENDPSMELVPCGMDVPGFEHGVLPGTEYAVRMYPHRVKGEGHFAALFRKKGELVLSDEKEAPLSGLPEFFGLVRKDALKGTLVTLKDQLYCVPSEMVSYKGRVLSRGLYLGQNKKYGFEPSQALAMALKAEDFKQCLCLSADDPRVEQYLKGNTITADPGYNGWVLVCAGQYPLGFAKASGGALKNKIDPGWRKL